MVIDKDGVSAAAMCAEMATYIYNQGMTITTIRVVQLVLPYSHGGQSNRTICHKVRSLIYIIVYFSVISREEILLSWSGPCHYSYIKDFYRTSE